MEKEIPSINTIQKGRKIRKEKIKVINNKIKKKYFSITFVCICFSIAKVPNIAKLFTGFGFLDI